MTIRAIKLHVGLGDMSGKWWWLLLTGWIGGQEVRVDGNEQEIHIHYCYSTIFIFSNWTQVLWIYLTQKLGNWAVSNEYSEGGFGSKLAQHASAHSSLSKLMCIICYLKLLYITTQPSPQFHTFIKTIFFALQTNTDANYPNGSFFKILPTSILISPHSFTHYRI